MGRIHQGTEKSRYCRSFEEQERKIWPPPAKEHDRPIGSYQEGIPFLSINHFSLFPMIMTKWPIVCIWHQLFLPDWDSVDDSHQKCFPAMNHQWFKQREPMKSQTLVTQEKYIGKYVAPKGFASRYRFNPFRFTALKIWVARPTDLWDVIWAGQLLRILVCSYIRCSAITDFLIVCLSRFSGLIFPYD